MFKLSMKMMKRDSKSAIFYTVAMTVAIAMTFVFSSLMNNQSLKSDVVAKGGNTFGEMSLPVTECLAFVVVGFCCFLIFYVNNYYVLNKKQEIAVLGTSGSSSMKTTIYLLYQTALLFLIACIPGFIIGYVLTNALNKYIANYMNVAFEPVSASALGFTLLLVGTMLIVLVMVVFGYVHRNDVKTILYSKGDMNVSGVMGKIKIPAIVYVVVYIAGIALCLFGPFENTTSYILISLVGVFGIVTVGISNFAKSWKKKKMYKNRYGTVSISNLSYTVIKSKVLLLLLIISVSVLFTLVLAYQSQPKEFISSVCGYVIIVILLSATIMYNLMIESKSRSVLYFNMWKIGYVKNELIKIVRQEMLMYYALVLFLPGFMMIGLGVRYYMEGMLTIPFFMILLAVYTAAVVLTGLINYVMYANTVKSSIVGER